jgi:hypothetical protein
MEIPPPLVPPAEDEGLLECRLGNAGNTVVDAPRRLLMDGGGRTGEAVCALLICVLLPCELLLALRFGALAFDGAEADL